MQLIQNKTFQLTLIFVAALLVRFGTMFFLETYIFRVDHDFGFGYGETAKHVALGEGFSLGYFDTGEPRPTAVAPPGYVYIVALVFSVFGIYSVESAIFLEIFQSLTAALTCLAFYHLGKKFNEATGLLAALGMAFYPPSILFSVARISPIILIVLLLAFIMHYLFRIQEYLRYHDVIICGILMGVNALMEPTVILFYIASCVWLFCWSSTSRLAASKNSIIMGLICIVCILPWTIRNYIVFDAFVPIKSSVGRHLLTGNHPYSNGIIFGKGNAFDKVISDEEAKRLKNLDEVTENKIMLRKALGFIKDDPGRFLRLTLKRFYYYWRFVNPYRPTPYDNLRIITYGPVLILAAMSIFLTGGKWRETSLLVVFFLSHPLIYYITQVTINRYKYTVEAFLVILAAYALTGLLAWFRGRRLAPLAAG